MLQLVSTQQHAPDRRHICLAFFQLQLRLINIVTESKSQSCTHFCISPNIGRLYFAFHPISAANKYHKLHIIYVASRYRFSTIKVHLLFLIYIIYIYTRIVWSRRKTANWPCENQIVQQQHPEMYSLCYYCIIMFTLF